MRRRFLFLLPILLWTGWATLEGAVVERKIVFLLDRSGSMYRPPAGTLPTLTFESEVTGARTTAAGICDQVDRYGDTAISFWRFGERNGLAPQAVDMTPAQAKAQLGDFFTTDRARYDQKWTYIAYSIFELVKRELKLPPNFSPRDKIPEDAKLLNVYVFTDGGENPDPQDGFDNSPYLAWLKQHGDRLQVRWQDWKFYPQSEQELVVRTGLFARPPANHVDYTVHFGIPTIGHVHNPQQPPADPKVDLDVPETIRLVPTVMGDPAVAQAQLADPRSVCSSEMKELASVRADELHVQSVVEWPGLSAGTPEWPVMAPGRPVVDQALSREILRLRIGSPRSAQLLPAVSEGVYPFRFDPKSLCQELSRLYPSSTFVFPFEQGKISRLGDIHVDAKPFYQFALTVQEATKPNDPLIPLVSDRFHRYNRATRTFRLTAPAGVTGDVEATVLVRHAGKTEEVPGIVSLATGNKQGGSITIPLGQPFTLSVPAQEQHHLRSLFLGGFSAEPGDYELTLRVLPRIAQAPDPDYGVRFACENCDPSRMRVTGHELALTIPFFIRKRPISWIWIVLAILAVITFLWVLIRWFTRKEFPEGLVVGKVEGHADLKTAHAHGLTGIVSRYKRRPIYVELLSGGKTVVYREPFITRVTDRKEERQAKQERNLLGIRPAEGRMHVWCVTARDGSRILLNGRALEPTGEATLPPGDPRLSQLLYQNVRDSETRVVVTDGKTETQYPVQYLRAPSRGNTPEGKRWAN